MVSYSHSVNNRTVDTIRHSPNMWYRYPAEFGRSRSNGTGVIKEIRLKHLTPRILFSRSLRVIGTDTDQSAIMTSYQHSIATMGLSPRAGSAVARHLCVLSLACSNRSYFECLRHSPYPKFSNPTDIKDPVNAYIIQLKLQT